MIHVAFYAQFVGDDPDARAFDLDCPRDGHVDRPVGRLSHPNTPAPPSRTANRIGDNKDEHGIAGGYDCVRRYVKNQRVGRRETFLPISVDAGQRAESDFGQIEVDFPEGRRTVSVLMITWAYSGAVFAIVLPSEKTEAILHGTMRAFEFFGCVPKELWWDNPKTVAKTILSGRD